MSVPMTDSPGRNDLYGIHYRHRHMSARGPSKRAMAVVQKFNCGSAIQSYKASIWWAVHIVIELSYTVQTGGEVFSWRHHDSSSTFFCCSRFCGRKRCVLTAAAVPQDTSVYAWELEVPYVLLHFRYESQAAIGCSVLHDGGQHVNSQRTGLLVPRAQYLSKMGWPGGRNRKSCFYKSCFKILNPDIQHLLKNHYHHF